MTSTISADAVAAGERERRVDVARWLAPYGSVLAGSILIALRAIPYKAYIIDDAFVTFAYARNIADGHGIVAQPGLHAVEGYSDPTWLAVFVVGHWLRLWDHGTVFGAPDYVFFPKALGFLCCVGILALVYSAAKLLVRRPWLVTLVVGVVLAAIPSFVIWCFAGLENPLYALLVTWLAVIMLKAVLTDQLLTPRVAIQCGVLALLAALTRPDGLIYLAAFPIVALLFVRRETVRTTLWRGGLSLAAFAVPFGVFIAWRYAEFGRVLPNTAIAKVQPPPSVSELAKVGDLVGYFGWSAVLLVAICTGVVLSAGSRLARALIALIVPLLLAMLAYGLLLTDWTYQFRYATPVWPLLAFVGTLAVSRVFSRSALRGRSALAVGTAGVVVLSGVPLLDDVAAYANSSNGPGCMMVERYGRLYNGMADMLGLRNASVAVPDVGGVLLTSRLRVYDLGGLADARLADDLHADNMAAYNDRVFDVLKPTFLRVRTGWAATASMEADPRLMRDYVIVFSESGQYNAPVQGDYIRRDMVTAQQLTQLRAYAFQHVWAIYGAYGRDNYFGCGDTLRQGQTPTL